MTKFALILLAFTSTSAFAAIDSIYCKVNDKVYHARSKRGHKVCMESLYDGSACFTGRRENVLELINEGGFNWGEAWLEGARNLGRDSIGYVWVDGESQGRLNQTMNRCKGDFFAKPPTQ